ncbi:MAG: DUF1015 family protein [bacterium]
MDIQAFQGLAPAGERANQVNCVPYDVVDTKEARQISQGNPYSLLHVDRAEMDLPDGTDIYSDVVYAKAKGNFLHLQKTGALVREKTPCVYVYRQIMGIHTQTGLAVACSVKDYEENLIKKHEKTRPDKEDDRTRLIDTIGAQTGPVFLTYHDNAEVDALTARVTKNAPTYDFTAPDGVRHMVWRVAGGEDFVRAFAKIPAVYIADGHHRAASAARVAKERQKRNPSHTGKEPYNYFLGVLFPSSQVKILPYNRCVHDLNGLSVEKFLAAVKAVFPLQENALPQPEKSGQVRMYVQGKWHGLVCSAPANADAVSRLDVSVLQDKLLAPILDIQDPRTSKRIDFVGGIRGTEELVRKVDSGQAAVAFSMFPTTVEQMMAIADAGQIMPPKSTWFEPKLRSGFFVHTF